MADFEVRNVFEGDFILAQTEVLFFKQKKKKKKQPLTKRCTLLITLDQVALTDPDKNDKTVLMFPRNTITDVRYNDVIIDNEQYKLEITVLIKNKSHHLCIEFPTTDAQHQRNKFIKHFTEDKAKPVPNNHVNNTDNQNHQNHPNQSNQTTSNNNNNNNNHHPPLQHTKQQQQTHQNQQQQQQQQQESIKHQQSKPKSFDIKRGSKRKRAHILDEETLRKRACKLAKHKYLSTLYRTLVGKEVLSASEFWDEYGKDIDIVQSSTGLIEGMSNTVLHKTMQRETWSLFSVFKDDIDNQEDEDGTDNTNKLTINLTAEKILEIFVHLPEVKLAYEQNVPFTFSEEEFWKSFLQSHYFKRETTKNVTSGISDKETAMDKLLKKYTLQLQNERNMNENMTGNDGSPSPGIDNNKGNDSNSFANQLAAMQLAKNKEVDVEGKLTKMREEIAMARAAKNGDGDIGDDDGNMQRFVDQMENGMINVHHSNGEIKEDIINNDDIDNDVDMKKQDENGRIEANKPLSRRNFKKKLNTLDPSIDLTATMSSFTEIIEDPGIDENKNMSRDDIQNWFSQVNKHGTMLLYQSLNQRNTVKQNKKNKNKKQQKDIQEVMINVPKVNYGRKYKRIDQDDGDEDDDDDDDDDDDQDDDIKMKEKDNTDNLNVMNMDYEDRLNVETEFNDLREEGSANYIELKIKDQSVYWGDNLLLNDDILRQMNQTAKQLYVYLDQVEQKKKRLSQQEISTLVNNKHVLSTIACNTDNNIASEGANLMSQRVMKQNNMNNMNNMNNQNKEETASKLLIFQQEKEISANPRILDQLPMFLKPMKCLVRHYWHCFPANHSRLQKAKILAANLKEYKLRLIQFKQKLDKKNKSDQKILLKELIDFADKVLEHNKMTEANLDEKKAKKAEILRKNVDV